MNNIETDWDNENILVKIASTYLQVGAIALITDMLTAEILIDVAKSPELLTISAESITVKSPK